MNSVKAGELSTQRYWQLMIQILKFIGQVYSN